MSAALQGAGALICICLVRLVGKRALSLVSMSGCALCCLSLGAYTYFITQQQWSPVPTIPLLLFCTLYFTMNLGISPIPWLLISEVFPNRCDKIKLCFLRFFRSAFCFNKKPFKMLPFCYAVTEDEERPAERARRSFTSSLSWCRKPGWIFKIRWNSMDALSCTGSLPLSVLYSYTNVCRRLKAKHWPRSKRISLRKTSNKFKYQTQRNNKITHYRVLKSSVYTRYRRGPATSVL